MNWACFIKGHDWVEIGFQSSLEINFTISNGTHKICLVCEAEVNTLAEVKKICDAAKIKRRKRQLLARQIQEKNEKG